LPKAHEKTGVRSYCERVKVGAMVTGTAGVNDICKSFMGTSGSVNLKVTLKLNFLNFGLNWTELS